MRNHERIFKYIGIIAIFLLLFGLFGWYIFIRSETAAVETTDQGRGFSIGIPSFLGSRGSTAANTGGSSGSGGGGAAAETGSLPRSGSSALLRFLGFGGGIGEGERAQDAQRPPGEATTPPQKRAPRFWRVSATPVAGASFLAGTSTRLRYVERATGHVFDVSAETGDVVRITNTLTPRVYEAYFGAQNNILERTIDAEGNPATLAGKIGTTTEDGATSLSSVNLGEVREIATLASSADIHMLTQGETGVSLIRAAWNGASPKVLLTIPAGDFRIVWPSAERVILVEKAASGIAGSAFEATNILLPLVRNIPGLTLRAHASSQAILYGSDDGERIQLFVKLPDASAMSLPLQTLADKCVWSPSGLTAYCAVPQGPLGAQFLNRWYRGEAHTEDVWYTVDAGAGTAQKLFTIDSAQAIDVENPVIDQKGAYLSFTNARDKSLWILRISEQ